MSPSKNEGIPEIENDYDKDVYNGDIGYVENADVDAGELIANFDGRPSRAILSSSLRSALLRKLESVFTPPIESIVPDSVKRFRKPVELGYSELQDMFVGQPAGSCLDFI